MITRLKVKGFKNLVNVDLRFSEFTCIAGPNGSGKSNLFDAIQFLSLTAERTIHEAALGIRGDGGKVASADHIFCHSGKVGERVIDFYVEMIVPKTAEDGLNQEANATFTFLTYELSIQERKSSSKNSLPLEIIKEQLSYIPWHEASRNLCFKHTPDWRLSLKQVGKAGGRRDFFISTVCDDLKCVIMRHQDGGSHGRPFPYLASNLPRTVLSTSNAAESPTALCAKREMESWRFLALESSSLRTPDGFNDPTSINSHGRHLPGALNRLIESRAGGGDVSARIARRLTELVENIRGIELDKDEIREAYSIIVRDLSGNRVPARGLSDGTLRFLALAIIEEDSKSTGVICLEEPENGIHPKRIPAMIALLRDIAVDPSEPCDDDNPLRQVIINTHSPQVVSEVPDDSLVLVFDKNALYQEKVVQTPVFAGLPKTWRDREGGEVVSRGILLPYLNPIERYPANPRNTHRVADREDLQALLPFPLTTAS